MQNQTQQRVFYNILTKVGSKHRYQTILSWIIFLYVYSTGASAFYNVFLFHENEYQCPSQIQNCKEFVCGLPYEERAGFINTNFQSLITNFGDFRCENYSAKDQAQSIIYFGGIVGILLSVYLTQKFTKWYLVFSCGIIQIICIIITLFAPTLTIATISLFLNFTVKTIMMQLLPCILIQTFDQSIRPMKLIILFTVVQLGSGFNGPLFKWLPWRLVLLIENIIPVSISVSLMYLYMEQTPFQMIIKYLPEESYNALQNISKINDLKFDKSITIQQLANIKQQYLLNNQKHEIQEISWLDLFRYNSLRITILCCSALNFSVGYQFDASELSLANYSIDIYYSGTILGFAGIIGASVCNMIMQNYKRKTLLYFAQGFCFISAMAVFIFAPCNNQQACQPSKVIIQAIGLIIFRFFNSVYVTVFYIYVTEVFPNQIRPIALICTMLSFHVGIVIIPIVQSWLKTIQISITIIFGLMSLLIILLQIPLRQTFGIPPQQIIEQLKYKHQALGHKQQVL